MNYALQKTLELLLIIGLGLLLQKKVAKDDLKGIKTLILSVALPATIFVALLKIELKGSLLIFPLMALVFNFIMAIATKFLLASSYVRDALVSCQGRQRFGCNYFQQVKRPVSFNAE